MQPNNSSIFLRLTILEMFVSFIHNLFCLVYTVRAYRKEPERTSGTVQIRINSINKQSVNILYVNTNLLLVKTGLHKDIGNSRAINLFGLLLHFLSLVNIVVFFQVIVTACCLPADFAIGHIAAGKDLVQETECMKSVQ